jgi:hypothetical protein
MKVDRPRIRDEHFTNGEEGTTGREPEYFREATLGNEN